MNAPPAQHVGQVRREELEITSADARPGLDGVSGDHVALVRLGVGARDHERAEPGDRDQKAADERPPREMTRPSSDHARGARITPVLWCRRVTTAALQERVSCSHLPPTPTFARPARFETDPSAAAPLALHPCSGTCSAGTAPICKPLSEAA